ncbi:MAG TPA: hypothetical protein VES00_19910 [Burkholderiaceae bacterium]|nr:hypothetical protein [Burkholderiaceae bacterium]
MNGPRAFVASDRLAGRARRAAVARPYLTLAIAAHVALIGVLSVLPGLGAADERRVAAARASRADAQVAATESRELQRRVQRLDAIARELGASAPADGAAGGASAPADDVSSPEALVARARALSAAIDAADRARRAAELARLTSQPLAEARRVIDAQAAARAPAASAAKAADIVAALERRARDQLDGQRARNAARNTGLPVVLPTRAQIAAQNVANAAASQVAASGSTGQQQVAAGYLRSRKDQLASMIRLGDAQGRVGIDGAASGRSVNREGVKGVEGGKIADEKDSGPRDLSADFPLTARGGAIDLARAPVPGSHDLVHYVDAPAVDPAAVRTGSGRMFGAGGTFATRVYIDSWYVIGPFEGRHESSIDTVYPPEEDVDLDGAYRGQGGQVLTWKYASRGFYPFIPPGVADNAVYYATTELRVDEERDVWLTIAADDDSKMWLDGRLVWVGALGDKPWLHYPYFFRDEDVASLSLSEGRRRVHLARGPHRLLFKLSNDTERAFFSVVVSS